MKALPLWQPWASLVAVGAKRVETRHWQAPQWLIGQRIAIHATKTKREVRPALDSHEAFYRHLDEAELDGRLAMVDGDLPYGFLLATAVLARCTVMTPESIDLLRNEHPDEHVFGLYEPGRFAWVLSDVERLPEPVPFKGSQGIFDVPDELLGIAPAQGCSVPNALTMAEAFEQAQRAARGHGMPGIRLGMQYGNQARALRALAAEDEKQQRQEETHG